ncbi:hypothetical protein pdam_00008221 [Pocillopora damicornis]|uniref:Uncharacterized protein n=1 Tax=Pocillopora damicornis TaxID=46731 RepID=A0A3M6UTS9_POCDA|nr:hypothetical protein pdam_00008221 [Pocillopora damicornis]
MNRCVSTSEPPPPSSVPVVLTIAIPLEDDTACSPPPPYEPTEDQDTARDTDLPPSYDIAAKLPTYEEVERNAILLDGGVEVALGNDWLFLICFILAFVFNWLGFFAAYCMTNTIAGRMADICSKYFDLLEHQVVGEERLSFFSASLGDATRQPQQLIC